MRVLRLVPSWVTAIAVIVALLLRLAIFPGSGSPPQSDEIGYLTDGLLVAEGITPGYKFVPAAPTTWLSAGYAAAAGLLQLASNDADVAGASPALRPIAGLDRALFDIYSDLTPLHMFVAACLLALCLAGIGAAARIGERKAGTLGGLAGGGLAALVPIFMALSVQTRPYAAAWSFALLSCAAASSQLRSRGIWAGIFLGLAVASRIDLALVFPLVIWFSTTTAAGGRRLREAGHIAGVAAIAFLIAAPWYLAHLLGNLRYVVSIRFLDPAGQGHGLGGVAALLWQEGLLAATGLLIVGAVISLSRQRRAGAAVLLYLMVVAWSLLHPSAFGLRHQGAFVVAVIALLPWAMDNIAGSIGGRLRTPAMGVMLAIVLLPAGYQALLRIREIRDESVPAPWVEWIEANVPAGATVYSSEAWRLPLPSRESGLALWAQVAAPDAWRHKLTAGMARFGLDSATLPHALSEEHMYQERANRRRYYMLAQPWDKLRPRYDFRPYSDGSAFDLSHQEAIDAVCRDGGVFVAQGLPPDRLGPPTVSWTHDRGGIFIFVRQSHGC